MASDYRQQLRGALAGLEMCHLAEQCFQSACSLITATAHPVHANAFLKDILQKGDVATCNRTARKHRYRLAAVLMEAGHGQQSAALLQQACKAALACMPLEQQPGDCAEFAALLGALARQLCAYQVGCYEAAALNGPPTTVSTALLEPLMTATSRSAAQEAAACGHLGLAAALHAVAQPGAAGHPGVDFHPELAWALRLQLLGMNSGSPRMQVPQAHSPVRECLGGLGCAVTAGSVRGCVKACLHGLAHQVWGLRRESAVTLHCLGEALQAAKAEGEVDPGTPTWSPDRLPPTGIAALLDLLPSVLRQLEDVKYDKIPSVRQACAAALPSLQRLAAVHNRSDLAELPPEGARCQTSPGSRQISPIFRRNTSTATPILREPRRPFRSLGNHSRAATPGGDELDGSPLGSLREAADAAGYGKSPASPLDYGIQLFVPAKGPPLKQEVSITQATTSHAENIERGIGQDHSSGHLSASSSACSVGNGDDGNHAQTFNSGRIGTPCGTPCGTSSGRGAHPSCSTAQGPTQGPKGQTDGGPGNTAANCAGDWIQPVQNEAPAQQPGVDISGSGDGSGRGRGTATELTSSTTAGGAYHHGPARKTALDLPDEPQASESFVSMGGPAPTQPMSGAAPSAAIPPPASPPGVATQTTASTHQLYSPAAPLSVPPTGQRQGEPCRDPDTHVIAGPLDLRVSGDRRAVEVASDAARRLSDEVDSLQISVHCAEPLHDFKLQVVLPSSRAGISTMHRIICSGGLMRREVVDCLTECPTKPTTLSQAPPSTANTGTLASIQSVSAAVPSPSHRPGAGAQRSTAGGVTSSLPPGTEAALPSGSGSPAGTSLAPATHSQANRSTAGAAPSDDSSPQQGEGTGAGSSVAPVLAALGDNGGIKDGGRQTEIPVRRAPPRKSLAWDIEL